MDREALIQTNGGKGGIMYGLLDEGIAVPVGRGEAPPSKKVGIPHSFFYQAGSAFSPLEGWLARHEPPFIVRFTHWGDYLALVDVLPTVGWIDDTAAVISLLQEADQGISGLENIMRMACHGDSGMTIAHRAQEDGIDLSTGVHALVQEQHLRDKSGSHVSVLQHPHVPTRFAYCGYDVYVSEDVSTGKTGLKTRSDMQFRFDDSPQYQFAPGEEFREIVYAALSGNTLDRSYAQHFELFPEKGLFLQARPFKPFQPKADFSFPLEGKAVSDDVFGITEGLRLPVAFYEKDVTLDRDSVLINTKHSHLAPFRGMRHVRVLVDCASTSYILHGGYMFLNRADVSLMHPLVWGDRDGNELIPWRLDSELKEGQLAEIKSDGIHGTIVPA
ncbi:MAG: hypothetical protein V1735_04910 [Nanoarchaeota archaeon]